MSGALHPSKSTGRAPGGAIAALQRQPALLLVAAVAIAISVGCSVERQYRVLRFFFDGVPDPSLIELGRSEVQRVRAAGGTIYTHEPYAREQCDTCHRTPSGRMLVKADATFCTTCHSEVLDKHRFMHGPVAVSACLWCHSPHESANKSLLRVDANTLCRQCHEAELSPRRRIPQHGDLTRSCLDCHSGHGGPERYFLHAGATAPAALHALPSDQTAEPLAAPRSPTTEDSP